ncbi:ABC transporter permease [Leucobacter triazinivorans]|uniref:ABC transporter permease subunit n=1 Tax=Leucobacter triazinivorans TaxID=1784719 RepID=A0A4P6KGD7_9MICO|nr:ABC transporter permease subunit [Leucobacter triazinivorans]QBE49300.1 ABC transporter permease subunit [Leucobacter triazinivorans]
MQSSIRASRAAIAPILYGMLGIVVLLAVWQWGSIQVASETVLPSVPSVVGALGNLLLTVGFWIEVLETLGIALFGWGLAAVLGVAVGVVVGTSDVANAAIRFSFEFLRPIPAIVILPLVMLILGPTAEMGVFLIVFGVTLPIAAQTAAGVESVDPVMLNTARSFGMTRGEVLWRVILPGASPFVGTAMRVAAPITLILTVVAGMLGGAPGIGNSLAIAQLAGRNEDIFAYVLVLGLMGLLLQTVAIRTERRLLHWHASYRKGH